LLKVEPEVDRRGSKHHPLDRTHHSTRRVHRRRRLCERQRRNQASRALFAEPATVQLVVAIEPDAENRTLRVEADGDTMFCATEIQLSGVKEQRLHTVQFKNLSAGGYTLRAQVLSNSAVRSQATQEIMVTGDGTEPDGW
jgi:hypothetical protein